MGGGFIRHLPSPGWPKYCTLSGRDLPHSKQAPREISISAHTHKKRRATHKTPDDGNTVHVLQTCPQGAFQNDPTHQQAHPARCGVSPLRTAVWLGKVGGGGGGTAYSGNMPPSSANPFFPLPLRRMAQRRQAAQAAVYRTGTYEHSQYRSQAHTLLTPPFDLSRYDGAARRGGSFKLSAQTPRPQTKRARSSAKS